MKRIRERRQRSAAAAETEKDRRIRQMERTVGRKSRETKNLKSVEGGKRDEVDSRAREMVVQRYTASLVAAILATGGSSRYHRTNPRGSGGYRTYDVQIVGACGEKLAPPLRRFSVA